MKAEFELHLESESLNKELKAYYYKKGEMENKILFADF